MREYVVSPCASFAIEPEHPRGAAIGERLLRDQLSRQDKVKIRDEHSSILLPRRNIAGEVAFRQATKPFKSSFHGESRLFFSLC
jgi:hypothetical protein